MRHRGPVVGPGPSDRGLVNVANDDLANGLGNAVDRIVTLRSRHQRRSSGGDAAQPLEGILGLAADVARLLGDFDRRAATQRIVDAITLIKRHIEHTAPSQLARQPEQADLLDLSARFDTADTRPCSSAGVARWRNVTSLTYAQGIPTPTASAPTPTAVVLVVSIAVMPAPSPSSPIDKVIRSPSRPMSIAAVIPPPTEPRP